MEGLLPLIVKGTFHGWKEIQFFFGKFESLYQFLVFSPLTFQLPRYDC